METDKVLLEKSKNAIEGLISLLCIMKENPEYYKNIDWSGTGHGQIAIKTLAELQSRN